MVVKRMQEECISFDSNKYCTPLLKHLKEKSRKRSSSDAFRETADALDHLELAPRVKRVVRRPPPLLTIYLRKETQKAYDAIFLEETTVEKFKKAVSLRYGLPVDSIKSIALRRKSGSTIEIDDQTVKAFLDEDDFIISLDYDSTEGTCKISLSCSPPSR